MGNLRFSVVLESECRAVRKWAEPGTVIFEGLWRRGEAASEAAEHRVGVCKAAAAARRARGSLSSRALISRPR